jgi:predicted RNA-binding Zn-ribbon protein involved in translation (DUF1610 family)
MAKGGIIRTMERVCAQCHAVLGEETVGDWCPACGGALIERDVPVALKSVGGPTVEVDHRGIVLPRRHAMGGIITPQ